MIKRDLKVAIEENGLVNVQHISTKEGVELVREARKKSNRVHAEATPQHIALTEDAVIKYGTNGKLNPPFREETDRQAIIAGLKDETIDIIATDHAPHSCEEKAKNITEAPSGIIGLETAFAIVNTVLVKEEGMSLSDVVAKLTVNPARLYGLDRGVIEEGKAADMAIADLDEKWIVKEFKSKSSNSPFTGRELIGRIRMTICDGEVVYSV